MWFNKGNSASKFEHLCNIIMDITQSIYEIL